MTPKVRVWIVFGDRVKFGAGRARLLEAIEARGSIKEAVSGLGMSYRNAWGYLRDLETAAGFPLLERQRGVGPRAGARLTPEGRVFLARYRRLQEGVEAEARRRFRRVFAPAAARRERTR